MGTRRTAPDPGLGASVELAGRELGGSVKFALVGKALSLLHARPERNWTIEKLGKDVGLSRSVLAERFADLVGMPPMQYLAKWRMQIASGLLDSGNTNIATVAAKIGYGSEAAFSRAFKKIVGVPPSDWRRGM